LKDYQKFSVNEFAMDEYFQSWILNSDEASETFWKAFIIHHPEKLAVIDEAREILHNFRLPRYLLEEQEISTLWQNIKNQKLAQNEKGSDGFVLRYKWHAVAALIIVGALIGLQISKQPTFEYKTNFGEMKTILLPDSSTVILNANSRLVYKKDWVRSTREVYLEGEAFFSVVHKQDHQPFRVKTAKGISVEVLGTTFNVYHRAIGTKVVLNSGQISLRFPVLKNEKVILMKPGELVECKKDRYTQRLVNPKNYLSWTDKKLTLNQTTLREMIQVARDTYGVSISIKNEKILDQTLSGSMPILGEKAFVMQLAKAFQLKVEYENRKYVLTQ
jgi:ferric-dicitrate binding protein FerR (iron transport regulator)